MCRDLREGFAGHYAYPESQTVLGKLGISTELRHGHRLDRSTSSCHIRRKARAKPVGMKKLRSLFCARFIICLAGKSFHRKIVWRALPLGLTNRAKYRTVYFHESGEEVDS